MKTTIEFLNAVKEKHNLPSDGRLAVMLGITRSSISVFMLGKNHLGDETAMRVADLLDLDPAHVVACIHAERAKTEKEKRMWERFATMTAGVSAAVLLAFFAPHFGGDSSLVLLAGSLVNERTLYIMSNSLFEYWPVFIPLFVLLFFSFPWHNTRKK